jgi:hypothetical protein
MYREVFTDSEAESDTAANYAYADCYWDAKSYPHAHTNTTASFHSAAKALGMDRCWAVIETPEHAGDFCEFRTIFSCLTPLACCD